VAGQRAPGGRRGGDHRLHRRHTTGLVTFDDPPAGDAVLTAGFEFDVPVRFDTDRIDVTLESFEAGRIVAVPLIELRI
jgi:uncharacterized protein (TIGR02217 family)